MSKKTALAPLAFASLLALPSLAHASGFVTARFGGEHGTPMNPGPESIYYNPAGLQGGKGLEIHVEYDLALRSASYTHAYAPTDVAEPPDAIGANNGKATLFNVVGAPFIGATYQITKDLGVGAAFYVPIGGVESWDQNSAFKSNTKYPGIVDGPQRWYSISGQIISLYWSVGAAYKIPGTGLSIGASGNLINTKIDTLRAHSSLADDDVTAETRALLDVSGFEGSFAVGANWEILEKKLWLGASYQARPNIAGGMKLNGTLDFHQLSPSAADTPANVSVYQAYPDILRWGARWRPTTFTELRLFGSWERWSNFTDQCISAQDTPCAVNADGTPANGTTPIQDLPRHWQDGFGVRAGGSYWVNPDVEMYVGLGYDSNAVPDSALEPDILDMRQIAVAAGAQWQVNEHLFFGLSYTNFFGLFRDTVGKSANASYQPPSNGPDAGGHYNQNIGLFNIMVGVHLL
jgi:long-chain fatty acid transport protein